MKRRGKNLHGRDSTARKDADGVFLQHSPEKREKFFGLLPVFRESCGRFTIGMKGYCPGEGVRRMQQLTKAQARQFAQCYLEGMDAVRAAQAVGRTDGLLLLEQAAVREQIRVFRRQLSELFTPEDTVRRMVQLAFGRANDCVKLALQEHPDVDSLDLSLLSEIKRNEKGTVEIKLMDRVRVLERLLALERGGEDEAAAFFRAMQGACGEAGAWEETD